MPELQRERRLYPRYRFRHPVELRGRWGSKFVGRCLELSQGGLTVSVTQDAIAGLGQGGAPLAAGDEFSLTLQAAPGDAAPVRFGALCRVGHVRRLSQAEFLVGARFQAVTAIQRQALHTLLERARFGR